MQLGVKEYLDIDEVTRGYSEHGLLLSIAHNHWKLMNNLSTISCNLAASHPQRPNLRRIQAKHIPGLQHVRIITRPKDLLLLPPPLGLVDSIDPILDLEYHAAILRDRARPVRGVVEEALRRLQRHRSVLPTTRVHLEGVLVCPDVELDAGPGGAQARDGDTGAPVVGGDAVGQVACVFVKRC